MKSKLLICGLVTLASVMPIRSVSANPSSCKASAITASERKSVEILEYMYSLQAKMNRIDKGLEKINRKKNSEYDSYDADSVDRYNELVDKYNSIVERKNLLSDKYNQSRDSFNAIVSESPSSSNFAFVNCLNMAVLNIDVSTTSLNVNSTSLNIDSLNNSTENMMRNLENLHY